MDSKKAELLIKKYLSGECTPDEKSSLENWYNQFSKDQIRPSEEIDLYALEKQIYAQLPMPRKTKYVNFRYAAAAAIILIALSYTVISVFHATQIESSQMLSQGTEIVPGGNKALLTLASGQVVDLDTSKSGIIILKEGVIYNDGTVIQDSSQIEGSLNTISTPRGGQYQIVLADGTKVWLNAGSKLAFPEHFSDSQRIVKAEGEVYFEVESDNDRPFIVNTKGMDIRVLGTSFNLSAYEEDPSLPSVSLIEGAVQLKAGASISTLAPGQKATVDRDKISITPFDEESEIAWKNGYFIFKDQNIKEIMNVLSRWYDAEIEYQGEGWEDKNFTVRISRRERIEEILSIIELTQSVKFKIVGRRVIISI